MRGLLGADVFVNLLLVFIITTGLLLMNANKDGKAAGKDSDEKHLPKIALPSGTGGGVSAGKPGNAVTLSAKKEGDAVQYFMDDKRVAHRDLSAALKEKRAASVRIRFDRDIPYGTYVGILDLCKQAGITDIVNVYTTHK